MDKTFQAVPKDLLFRVLKKLKPDYEIFNYKIPFEIPKELPDSNSLKTEEPVASLETGINDDQKT